MKTYKSQQQAALIPSINCTTLKTLKHLLNGHTCR